MAVGDLFLNCLKEAKTRTIDLATARRSFGCEYIPATSAYHFGSLFMMNELVGLKRYQVQIFEAVIGFIDIFMVNYFAFTKWAAEIFRHYQNLFRDISVLIGVRMIRTSYQDITPSRFSATALPTRIRFALPASFRSSHNGSLTLIGGEVK